MNKKTSLSCISYSSILLIFHKNYLKKVDKMQIQDLYRGGYLTKSQINLELIGTTTYRNLLLQYDPDLKEKIQVHNSSFLGQTVYLINAHMQPEKLKWKIWKCKDELIEFIYLIKEEIDEMILDQARNSQNIPRILELYTDLSIKMNFDRETMDQFMQFINLLADQPYIRKTEEFLLFIQHCMPLDKWNIKVYQQLVVDKPSTKSSSIKNFFFSCGGETQNRSPADRQDIERDYFITIVSDGILKSDNHLMESRISSMIPFTNQLHYESKISSLPESHLSFSVRSCTHQDMDLHFYKNYIKGVNFAIGLKMALREGSYHQEHLFGSFAQKRQNCGSKFYNDGQMYFSDLYDELINAHMQVCITGWMITPYFLLKRPNKITNKKYRLDGVLETIAKRGVKVFIIPFREPKLLVNNDSEHVQYYFQSLHPNIRVIRHPDDLLPSLWSHHEKLVIIDQRIGFMGGLDICYGRWDTPEHRLVDPGDLWDGLDYNNARIKDVYQPREYLQSNINPRFQPRMPWHDIAIQFRGDIVLDLLRHFVQYWYFAQADQEFQITDIGVYFSSKISAQTKNPTHQLQIQNARETMERDGDSIREKYEKKKQDWEHKKDKSSQKREDILPQLFIQTKSGSKSGYQKLQLCRSASNWSIGIPENTHQQSIHKAYKALIQQSKNFIYLENQFFMGIENKIVDCLVERIIRAYKNQQKFRVIIVLPLLPGFEGDIANPKSSVLRIQVYHQYNAIIKGEKSLYRRLNFIENIDDYLFIFGLRANDLLDDVPITEMIYVHSKLLIIDDQRAIIGSANVNDRSLLGLRDSELACIIEEKGNALLEFRSRIFNEHFGLTLHQTSNIMNDAQWKSIIENAKRNTLIYRRVFGCIPDDTVTIVGEITRLASDAKLLDFFKLKDQIVGHAVEYPLSFLKDEDLSFKPNQKQFIMPEKSFT